MITLMPVGMWLTETYPELDEDDVDESGRLVIDIPDPTVNADCIATGTDSSMGTACLLTDLRGDLETSTKENETAGPSQNTNYNENKAHKVSSRNNRDIPIKLLLKRSFQNSRKNHQERRLKIDTKDDENINKCFTSNTKELLAPEQNTNQGEIQERANGNNIVANDIYQRVSSVNYENNTAYATLQTKARTDTIKSATNGKSFPQNLIKSKTPTVSPETHNPRTYNIKSHKEECHECKLNLAGDGGNHRGCIQNYIHNEANLSSDKHRTLNNFIQSHKDKLISTQNQYSNQGETLHRNDLCANNVEQKAHNNIVNNHKNECDLHNLNTSSQFYQINLQKHKQRISVVSNDFLFQHHSKIKLRDGTNKQYQIDNEQKKSPQLYQETFIDLMEQQYQLAVRENVPITVNKQFLHQEPIKEIADTRLTEIIPVNKKSKPKGLVKNIAPRRQRSTNIVSQHKREKNRPIAAKILPKTHSPVGYNILVHQGPDVNRIVITIANEKDEINNTTNQSPSGDQRVPDSMYNSSNSEACQSSQKKRSYYYREPSLRSFRRRSLNQRGQKQVKNGYNRFDPPDHILDSHKNVAQHYSYLGNQYELPTPVIKNYLSTVTPTLIPWEQHNRRLDKSGLITGKLSDTEENIPYTQNYYHINPHEEQIPFTPLNLSLKPLSFDKRLCPDTKYPNFHPRYPLPVQGYY